MKKLLVLMLVLGMASLASAGLTFTSNSEISGSVTLSLEADMLGNDGETQPVDYEYYLVMVSKTLGTIGAGTVVLGNISFDKSISYWPTYYLYPAMGYAGLNPATDSANYGFVGDSSGGAINGTAISSIAFTHIAGQEGVISLYVSPGGEDGTYSVVDTINVIPEPMTLALLGLGGLFLRRKK